MPNAGKLLYANVIQRSATRWSIVGVKRCKSVNLGPIFLLTLLLLVLQDGRAYTKWWGENSSYSGGSQSAAATPPHLKKPSYSGRLLGNMFWLARVDLDPLENMHLSAGLASTYDKLQEAGEREVWASLLRLLLPVTQLKISIKKWMDDLFFCYFRF